MNELIFNTGIGEQDNYSIDSLIAWLDAKYLRHKEIEDKHSADALRELKLARKLHWLAANDHIFFASYNEKIKDWDDGAHAAINCNEIFVPGADAEGLPDEEVDSYLALCKEFSQDAEAAWCVAKRNEKPWRGFKINEAALAKAKELLGSPSEVKTTTSAVDHESPVT